MIRLASENDLNGIDDIYNQAVARSFMTAHSNPMNQKERTEWFENHPPEQYPVYVFEIDSEVVGWVSLSPYRPGREALDEVAEISLYVDFNYQGEGIGFDLVKHCMNRAKTLKKRVYFAIIIQGNRGSIRLMEKCGFEKWGYLPEVIHFNGEKRGHIYYGKVLNSES